MELKPCPFCGAKAIDGVITHSNECFIHKLIYMRPANEVEKAWQIRADDPLLMEMAEALEEIVRCLSHGLQDCRASVTAKAMLQKYYEQNGELK